MADQKITEFLPTNDFLATDVIPTVRAGGNRIITAGVLAANLPSVGNRGTTKDVITSVTSPSTLVLNTTLFKISTGSITVPAGTPGQLIILLFSQACSVMITGVGFISISGTTGSTVTLRYDTSGWFVQSSHSVTLS